MAPDAEESQPLTAAYKHGDSSDSLPFDAEHPDAQDDDTLSTTSLVFDHLNDHAAAKAALNKYTDKPQSQSRHPGEFDDVLESEDYLSGLQIVKPVDRKLRRALWLVGILCLLGWLAAGAQFLARGNTFKNVDLGIGIPGPKFSGGGGSDDGSGRKRKLTLASVLGADFKPAVHAVRWIRGPEGEDGLLLERGASRAGYLIVDDVRNQGDFSLTPQFTRRVLMRENTFVVPTGRSGSPGPIYPSETWPSPNLKTVLVISDRKQNWRHSFTGAYWLFDVASQRGEPLDPRHPGARIQLAKWSPRSDAVAFVRENNLYIRKLDSAKTIIAITRDGGEDFFYGIPDWVYEEEVFGSNSATWWSEDGKYLAFLQTNESQVPTYPIQYFIQRPSGTQPLPGEENYPEVRDIKYPKAGAPNPTVKLQFYDVSKAFVFSVPIDGDFPDDDRLITEVVWAGDEGKVLIKETNRVSNVLKVVLIDASTRSGQTVREDDVKALDGGWFEVTETTTYVPAAPDKGRPQSGYVDTIIVDGYDHLGYFSPLGNSTPIVLTSGEWEVVAAPSAIDVERNWVYFVGTKESSIQRHVYRVKLDGTDLESVTDNSAEAYYQASFSTGGGYALVDYKGPDIPWQKVISMPGTSDAGGFEKLIENNAILKEMVDLHEFPQKIYQTVTIDGLELNLLERRPPHFNEKKQYPVLFYMYQGPGSQTVDQKFNVDFQTYVAAGLGYIVVTLDGRGTGFRGRKTRCVVRNNIGFWEAHDQIAAAKMWAEKAYVDADRMAIWGWSYGGFMSLKTLETDGGQTFKYGMAVAPVTDWRFYDSIYTERYMDIPQRNRIGYENTSIHDVDNLSKNVRFLVMHGVADDNVHTQSTYTLVDKLDLAGVSNYDMHVFPDSDHGIYFHNANMIVYKSKFLQSYGRLRLLTEAELENWLVNAFNGEWLRTANPKPIIDLDSAKRLVKKSFNALLNL
jgi:dipeptidyl aminopeptidase B